MAAPGHGRAGALLRQDHRALVLQGTQRDPVAALREAVRNDAGRQTALGTAFVGRRLEPYPRPPHWRVKRHVDNLRVQVDEAPTPGPMPGYSTVARFLRARGMHKKRRRSAKNRPGLAQAEARLTHGEVRSYEVEYVNGLWPLDFHDGSRAVLTPQGRWVKPILLGVLDDRSRLACHVQGYWTETAEDLVHGLRQAFCKWGLPRALTSTPPAT